LVAPGRADGDGPIVLVERHERAGGVEADALDALEIGWAEARLPQRIAHGPAARLPDVLRGLLDEVRLGPEDPNPADAEPEAVPRTVEDGGAGASRTDVDADERGRAHDVRFRKMRTRNPSSCESATISSNTSPYATATWLDR